MTNGASTVLPDALAALSPVSILLAMNDPLLGLRLHDATDMRECRTSVVSSEVAHAADITAKMTIRF